METKTKRTAWAALEVGCETNMDNGMDALKIVRDGDHSNPVALVLPDYDVGPDDDELTDEVRAFAKYIVGACNSFPALAKALEDICEASRVPDYRVHGVHPPRPLKRLSHVLALARKALADAGVGT